MSVRLSVRNSDKLYHPGDRIVGTLSLHPIGEGKTVTVGQVRVEFIGRCQTRVGDHATDLDGLDKNSVSLFCFKEVLLDGPYTVASVQEWPFTFSFPADCRHASVPAFEMKERERPHFDRDKSQSLPPSMRLASDLGAEDSKSCNVEYSIRGVLDLQGKLHTQREARCELRLGPYGNPTDQAIKPERSMYPQNMKIVSPHLDPSVGDRKLSTKEKLKAKMSSHVPSVSFKLEVAMPKAGTIFEPISILLSLQHASSDKKEELPAVLLREFSIKAIQNVKMATNSSGGTFEETLPTEIISQERSLITWSGSEPVEGQFDLSTLYDRERMDWHNITPTFRTFNIEQTWALWLTATVEVARKTDTIHVKRRSFKILSPYYSQSSADATPITDMNARMAPSDTPPSYEQAAKE